MASFILNRLKKNPKQIINIDKGKKGEIIRIIKFRN